MLDDFTAGARRKFRFRGAPIEDYEVCSKFSTPVSSLAAA
jgi:hypothetical protein